jgi:hypothetical protein
MTMPHLMNCPHSDDGWCIDCVSKLWRDRSDKSEEVEHLKEIVEALKETNRNLQKEIRFLK